MGELTVRNLISAGIVDVVVANRTFQRAVELSERFKGTPIMLHELGEYLPSVDILISSIASPDFLIRSSELLSVMAQRDNRPIFLVDISVPRSIEPTCGSLENVHLYNIDDLRAVVDSNAEERRREAQKGELLIEERLPDLLDHLKSYDLLPTLVSIRSKAEEIRKDGIAHIVDSQSISSQEKATIDALTKTIVNKVLHHSELKLREYTSRQN